MKKIISLFLICVISLSLVSCGENTEPRLTTELTNETTKGVSYPVTIVDQAGREVIIEQEPQSIVSPYYISTSLLIALDLDEKLVGVESNAGKRPIYNLSAKRIIDLPGVGSLKEFDLEGCVALKPDVVIMPLKLKDSAETLDNLGIKTIIINPESEQLFLEMIDIVSIAANKVDKGNALKSFIADKKDWLNQELAQAERKRVYLSGNSNFLRTAGNKMYQSDMIRLAGGESVSGEIDDSYWVDIDYEQLLIWNPDYIIIAADASYSVEDVLNDAVIKECSAVVNKNVYKIPSDAESWDSPVPGSILGSVWMAGILHEDVISSEEIDDIIEEFYEKFYGFKYSEK